MWAKVVAVLVFASLTCCSAVAPYEIDALSGVENYAFENEIRKVLEDLRDLLKNGNPEEGIPPMEPLPVDYFKFDFIIDDQSGLEGYFRSLLIHNISDYIVTDVNFDVVGFRIQLGLLFPTLTIDGNCKAKGLILNEVTDGEGTFISNTTDLQLNVMLHLGANLAHSQIKEFEVNFEFANDDIKFMNGAVEEHFTNDFLQPFLYRIRDEIFPKLLNTLKIVGTDVIYDLTLQQILDIVINGILGGENLLISLRHFGL